MPRRNGGMGWPVDKPASRFARSRHRDGGFGLAKKKEIHLVRLVGLGKMLKIPVELIKERISATYV